MNADIPTLLQNHGIHTTTKGPHTAQGWINTTCPFCEDSSVHLGWNIDKGYFHCWKCGGHRTEDTIAALLKIPDYEVYPLLLRYKLRPSAFAQDGLDETPHASVCKPPGTILGPLHLKYLINRNYDPEKLTRLWHLTGTGSTGPYAFRVVYPIYHNRQVVSFQGRDITGRGELRWKTCRKEDEVRDHKHCLGGVQHATGNSVAIVEGATDGWRLGKGAVWTFGTSYLLPQVNLLRAWKRRFIILDSADKDENAAVSADRLAGMLSAFDGETHIVELDSGDPGDMKQDDADALMRELKIGGAT